MSAAVFACGTVAAGRPVIGCNLASPKSIVAGMGASEICDQFIEALNTSLSDTELKQRGALTAEIAVTRQGELIARISEMKAGSAMRHPEVAIAVMDRAIEKEDISLLAKQAAAMLRR